MIEVRCRSEGGALVFEVEGEVCLVSAPVLVSAIQTALDVDDEHIVLDLSKVTLFGSTGANVVIELAEQLTTLGRNLSIRGAQGLTAYVLDLTGLDSLVESRATT